MKMLSGAALAASLLVAGAAAAHGRVAKAHTPLPDEESPWQSAPEAGGYAGAVPYVQLSGPGVAGALAAANNSEIQEALIALSHSLNPAVIAYAEQMIRDHDLANRQIAALSQRTGFVPLASAVSQQLDLAGTIQSGVLLDLYGPDFDVVYMDAQIRAHTYALRIVDSSLGPMASFPAFARALAQARGMIAQHLDWALAIRG
jgi:predicted outer membrane protein